MCAVLVVVANILREPAFQVAFVLPRTFERSAERIHPQGSNRCRDLQSILGITIKDDEPRSGSKWKREIVRSETSKPSMQPVLFDSSIYITALRTGDEAALSQRAVGRRFADLAEGGSLDESTITERDTKRPAS